MSLLQVLFSKILGKIDYDTTHQTQLEAPTKMFNHAHLCVEMSPYACESSGLSTEIEVRALMFFKENIRRRFRRVEKDLIFTLIYM